jgi:hypothetical protein
MISWPGASAFGGRQGGLGAVMRAAGTLMIEPRPYGREHLGVIEIVSSAPLLATVALV